MDESAILIMHPIARSLGVLLRCFESLYLNVPIDAVHNQDSNDGQSEKVHHGGCDG